MTAAPAASPTPDARAEEIFARARRALGARTYPAEIAYGVRVSGLRDGTWTARTYRTYERWPSGRISARTISDEETADPTRPKGSNINFFAFNIGGDGQPLKDLLGTPRLAVTYAFGLVPPSHDVPLPGDVPTPVPGEPRTIGSVSALARTYDVRLAGEETIGAATCWHLTLKPLGNPGAYRLRDLYVEEATDQIVRLKTDGNFTTKATGSGLWTVDYAAIDGRWYLADEISDGSVDSDAGTFDKVDVRFVDVRADLRENLDFGLAGSDDVPVLAEPGPP
ncbi:MAG: hypothetical protein IAI48_05315 [Candidatus Eremiobacteraeota bacterium]|nr:hypothetical protein [Candidatus Eremiobacteraeota bacterium]